MANIKNTQTFLNLVTAKGGVTFPSGSALTLNTGSELNCNIPPNMNVGANINGGTVTFYDGSAQQMNSGMYTDYQSGSALQLESGAFFLFAGATSLNQILVNTGGGYVGWGNIPGNPATATVDTTDDTVTPLISYTISTINTLVTLSGIINGFSDDNTVQYTGQFRIGAYLDGDLTDPATIVGTGWINSDQSDVLLAVTFSTNTNGLIIVNVTGLSATNMKWVTNYTTTLTTYS